ncbi:MAG TPA: GFA family protein [Polyangiaceae bacterium]
MSRYQGGCHCGAVRFEAELELDRLTSCNCSICGRSGTILAFVPASDFKQSSGEDSLTDYQFGKHSIHHAFCRHCGIKSFARGKNRDGSDMVAVNVRCLDGIDVHTLTVANQFDGRSL